MYLIHFLVCIVIIKLVHKTFFEPKILNKNFFQEWLPLLLGTKFTQQFKSLHTLSKKEFSHGYNDKVDPRFVYNYFYFIFCHILICLLFYRVSNAFAAAAFRIGHTLIPSTIQTFDPKFIS